MSSPATWTTSPGGEENLGLWLHIVDRRITQTIGLRHSDLPYQPWREDHDAGTDPVDYADQVMRDELTRPTQAAGEGPTTRGRPLSRHPRTAPAGSVMSTDDT